MNETWMNEPDLFGDSLFLLIDYSHISNWWLSFRHGSLCLLCLSSYTLPSSVVLLLHE